MWQFLTTKVRHCEHWAVSSEHWLQYNVCFSLFQRFIRLFGLRVYDFIFVLCLRGDFIFNWKMKRSLLLWNCGSLVRSSIVCHLTISSIRPVVYLVWWQSHFLVFVSKFSLNWMPLESDSLNDNSPSVLLHERHSRFVFCIPVWINYTDRVLFSCCYYIIILFRFRAICR